MINIEARSIGIDLQEVKVHTIGATLESGSLNDVETKQQIGEFLEACTDLTSYSETLNSDIESSIREYIENEICEIEDQSKLDEVVGMICEKYYIFER